MKSRPEARPRRAPVVTRKRALLADVYGRGSAPGDKSRENLCARHVGGAGNTRISPRKSPILRKLTPGEFSQIFSLWADPPIKFSSHRSVERCCRDVLTETRGTLDRESRSVRAGDSESPKIGPFEDPTRFRSRHALSDATATHGPDDTPTRRPKILEKITHPLPPRPAAPLLNARGDPPAGMRGTTSPRVSSVRLGAAPIDERSENWDE